jgi:hypothetical protein
LPIEYPLAGVFADPNTIQRELFAMNLTPIPPVIIGAAGAPLAQTKGSEVQRAQQETAQHERQVQNETKAEMASGIGTTDEQSGADSERDADGRRLWEAPPGTKDKKPAQAAPPAERLSRDASGQSGTQLDLSG